MTKEETRHWLEIELKTWEDECKSKHPIKEALSVAIKELEQEAKTGHWIRKIIRNEKGGCIGAEMICSKCGEDNERDKYMNYCPNCGAKMEEVGE